MEQPETMTGEAGRGFAGAHSSATCCLCNWTNVSLLNLGKPGSPRWTCHGCCKRMLDALERILRYPVHSEPVGGAVAMQDIAYETLSPNAQAEPRPGKQPKTMDEENKLATTHDSETAEDKGRCAPASCSAQVWQCDLGNGQWDHDWQEKHDSAGGEGGGPIIEWSWRECRVCGAVEGEAPDH